MVNRRVATKTASVVTTSEAVEWTGRTRHRCGYVETGQTLKAVFIRRTDPTAVEACSCYCCVGLEVTKKRNASRSN